MTADGRREAVEMRRWQGTIYTDPRDMTTDDLQAVIDGGSAVSAYRPTQWIRECGKELARRNKAARKAAV